MSIRPQRGAVIAAALGLATWATRAAAQQAGPAPVALEWIAPMGCPSQPDVLAQITRMVGTVHADSTPLLARVLVSGSAGTFRGEVVLSASGQTSLRTIAGESCQSVSDAVALIVALAVNPDSTSYEPANRPPPPLPLVLLSPLPPLKLAPHVRWMAGASLLSEIGRLPSGSFGAEISAGIDARPLQVEATGGWVASRPATLASRPDDGADISLARLGSRVCYGFARSRIRIGPCLGTGIEWIRAQGFGANQRWPAEGRLGTLSLGARVAVSLGSRLALRLCIEQVTAFHRLIFVIDHAGSVFTTPLSAFRGSFGAELHF